MRRASLVALAVTVALVAAADLAHKATAMAGARPVAVHDRSAAYVLVLAVAVAWAAALVAAGSPPLAAAGGLVAGGALGNVASLVFWSGVPNPLVVETGVGRARVQPRRRGRARGRPRARPAAVALLAVRRRRELGRPVRAG